MFSMKYDYIAYDKQTETVKNKTNHTESKSEERKETETEMSKGIEKMKSNDKRIESKVEDTM